MAPLLTAALFAKPAANAARVAAGEYLKQLVSQLDAFNADDSAGFHDIRVSLRRLRSWMRAFRPELDDTVRAKTRQGLRKIARATNAPRDAEAALGWIAQQSDLSARDRTGARYLADRLERERADADEAARGRIRRKLPKLTSTLAKELGSYWIRYDVEEPTRVPSMARAVRDTLVTHAARFARTIDRIESADDATRIHRVRIAAKRLRYLLETIDEPAAVTIAERLAVLQDKLGVAHDAHAIVNRIVRELGEVGARDARIAALAAINPALSESEGPRLTNVRPGLKTLATRAKENERAAFDAFRSEWSTNQVADTVAAITVLCDDLVERTHRDHARGRVEL